MEATITNFVSEAPRVIQLTDREIECVRVYIEALGVVITECCSVLQNYRLAEVQDELVCSKGRVRWNSELFDLTKKQVALSMETHVNRLIVEATEPEKIHQGHTLPRFVSVARFMLVTNELFVLQNIVNDDMGKVVCNLIQHTDKDTSAERERLNQLLESAIDATKKIEDFPEEYWNDRWCIWILHGSSRELKSEWKDTILKEMVPNEARTLEEEGEKD